MKIKNNIKKRYMSGELGDTTGVQNPIFKIMVSQATGNNQGMGQNPIMGQNQMGAMNNPQGMGMDQQQMGNLMGNQMSNPMGNAGINNQMMQWQMYMNNKMGNAGINNIMMKVQNGMNTQMEGGMMSQSGVNNPMMQGHMNPQMGGQMGHMNPQMMVMQGMGTGTSQSQGAGFSVIFRASGATGQQAAPIIVQCMPDEKVSAIIDKYRNKSGDPDPTKKFIFNTKNLAPGLSVAEAGIANNANIFVVSTIGIKGGF